MDVDGKSIMSDGRTHTSAREDGKLSVGVAGDLLGSISVLPCASDAVSCDPKQRHVHPSVCANFFSVQTRPPSPVHTQAVRVSWQQRPPSNIDRPQSGFDATIRKGILRVSDADGQLEDPDLVESQQMEAAVRSSLADLGRGGLAGLAPPAPVATPAARDRVYATGHDYPEDPDPDFAESRQMEAAARNSLADLGRGGAAGVAPRAPDAAPSYGAEMPLLVVHPAGSRGASGDRARGQEIAQHWDSVLDGAAIPAGLAADTGVGPNEESGDWDGVLAEAISVVEWDLPDEISSEARREGFRRNMLVLLGDAVERNGHRVRVRNGNSTFQANIGR